MRATVFLVSLHLVMYSFSCASALESSESLSPKFPTVLIIAPEGIPVNKKEIEKMVADVNSHYKATLEFNPPELGKEPQADIGLKLPENQGLFQKTYRRVRNVWEDGEAQIFISGRYWHLPKGFSEEQRNGYNDLAWGGGYGRSVIDEWDNQKLVYAMVTSDSHKTPLYLAGYAWLARWKVLGELKVGAGFSVTLIAHRTMTGYVPAPAPTPLLSLGTDKRSAYLTYINNIIFLFASIPLN